MNLQIKTYYYEFAQAKTYFLATLFIIGNVLLPQLCHLIPNGGQMLIPIFFFTLIAASKYGLTVGLITAIASPLVNNLLFGMPSTPILGFILLKSILLAGIATLAVKHYKTINPLILLSVVLSYQIAGSAVQYLFTQNYALVSNIFITAIPGMLIQVAAGYLILKHTSRNTN